MTESSATKMTETSMLSFVTIALQLVLLVVDSCYIYHLFSGLVENIILYRQLLAYFILAVIWIINHLLLSLNSEEIPQIVLIVIDNYSTSIMLLAATLQFVEIVKLFHIGYTYWSKRKLLHLQYVVVVIFVITLSPNFINRIILVDNKTVKAWIIGGKLSWYICQTCLHVCIVFYLLQSIKLDAPKRRENFSDRSKVRFDKYHKKLNVRIILMMVIDIIALIVYLIGTIVVAIDVTSTIGELNIIADLKLTIYPIVYVLIYDYCAKMKYPRQLTKGVNDGKRTSKPGITIRGSGQLRPASAQRLSTLDIRKSMNSIDGSNIVDAGVRNSVTNTSPSAHLSIPNTSLSPNDTRRIVPLRISTTGLTPNMRAIASPTQINSSTPQSDRRNISSNASNFPFQTRTPLSPSPNEYMNSPRPN